MGRHAPITEGWSDLAYSVMRIAAGVLFLCHGLQKLLGWFGGHRVDLMTQFGVAGIIETVGGILILLGLFTSVTALIASVEMIAAYFIAHAPRGGLPIQNAGELALLYCVVFAYVAARGDGRYSLGAVMRRRAD
jgi:putative oxidoreductase